MQQATACKTVNVAASFSCALKNKGLEMLTFFEGGRGEMILIGQFFGVESPGLFYN